MQPIDTLYIICGTMRTGSHLLQFLLRDAGIGDAQEYLHGDWPILPTAADYAERIRASQSGSVVGLRLFWGHLWGVQRDERWQTMPVEYIFDQVVEALNAREIYYLWLTRRDVLRQAVSDVRANTVKRWYLPPGLQRITSAVLPRTRAAVDRVDFLRREFPKYNARWQAYFETRGLVPLQLVYEDWAANDAAILETFWHVVAFLGVDVPAQYRPTVPLRKMAGQDVEEWIAWYQAQTS